MIKRASKLAKLNLVKQIRNILIPFQTKAGLLGDPKLLLNARYFIIPAIDTRK